MSSTNCPFCHAAVLDTEFESHLAEHTKLRPDGQMTEHVTERPDNRYLGSLDQIPRAYRHPKCGVTTGMPEEIIRSYLINPFLYSDGSFCCGCNDYVSTRELFWVETGESLYAYQHGLQSLHRLRARPEGLTQENLADLGSIGAKPHRIEARLSAAEESAPPSDPKETEDDIQSRLLTVLKVLGVVVAIAAFAAPKMIKLAKQQEAEKRKQQEAVDRLNQQAEQWKQDRKAGKEDKSSEAFRRLMGLEDPATVKLAPPAAKPADDKTPK